MANIKTIKFQIKDAYNGSNNADAQPKYDGYLFDRVLFLESPEIREISIPRSDNASQIEVIRHKSSLFNTTNDTQIPEKCGFLFNSLYTVITENNVETPVKFIQMGGMTDPTNAPKSISIEEIEDGPDKGKVIISGTNQNNSISQYVELNNEIISGDMTNPRMSQVGWSCNSRK